MTAELRSSLRSVGRKAKGRRRDSGLISGSWQNNSRSELIESFYVCAVIDPARLVVKNFSVRRRQYFFGVVPGKLIYLQIDAVLVKDKSRLRSRT